MSASASPADRPPRVYLDAAQSAPWLPAGREALLAAVDDGWADPRRLHREGRRARILLDGAREAIAAELGARTEEVSFPPSHADAVHAAVLGVLGARRRSGSQVLLSAVEHSAVLSAAGYGGEPVLVGVDRLGRVDAERFTARLAESRSGGAPVALAALQSANGETGTIQPVARVAEAARAAGVPLLMDAAATVGHVRVPQEWDLLTADPAAWGAPGGVGVLAVRARTRWSAPGPSSEGTEPTPGQPFVPGVLAAAVALQAMSASRSENDAHRRELVSRIRTAAEAIGDTEVVGDPRARLPHLVTFSCLYVDGEAVVGELDRAGFSVGSGSACTASTLEPSHVLAAMGVLTHGNIRIGLPTGITAPDVGRFCAELPGAIARVRAMLGAESL